MLRVRTLLTGVAGSPWYVNTYHFGSDQADADNATARVRVFWDTIKAKIVSGVTIQVQTDVADVAEVDGEITTYLSSPTLPVTATGSGLPLPFSNQALVRLGTDAVARGRRVQGRLLIPGYVTGESTFTGTPTAGSISSTNAAAAPLRTPGGTGALGVWHRPLYTPSVGSLPPVLIDPGQFHPATSAIMQPKWAVLRSRRD